MLDAFIIEEIRRREEQRRKREEQPRVEVPYTPPVKKPEEKSDRGVIIIPF